MSRIAQPPGSRGSLKWIQRAVKPQLSGAQRIDWRSSRAEDSFAEYRDASFLRLLGLGHLGGDLGGFWPTRGPQWDALGVSDARDVLLLEAKAHVAELCSPGTAAGPESRARIAGRLGDLATRLGARADRADWTTHFYQLANRLAHLAFLRERGVPAWLVLVNFIGDGEMGGPSTAEAWRSAYAVAWHVMGLPRRHALNRWIVEVYPDVRELAG